MGGVGWGVFYYRLLATHCLLLTTRHSPLTTHYSLLTIHHPLSHYTTHYSTTPLLHPLLHYSPPTAPRLTTHYSTTPLLTTYCTLPAKSPVAAGLGSVSVPRGGAGGRRSFIAYSVWSGSGQWALELGSGLELELGLVGWVGLVEVGVGVGVEVGSGRVGLGRVGLGWELSEKCLGSVQEMSGNCPGSIWEVSRQCLGSIWEVSRKCVGSVQEVSGKCQPLLSRRISTLRT